MEMAPCEALAVGWSRGEVVLECDVGPGAVPAECVFFYAWMSGVADAAGGGRLVRFLWPCVIVCAARVCGIPIVCRAGCESARPTAVTSIALILFSIISISE